ncbi:MAG: sulfite exporter TauE/SafE family protein [Lentimicrobiaceae bacterium]
MNNLLFTLLIYIGSFSAGLLGSLTGLGGGVIVVPMLTVLFGVDIHFAAGASLISVIATSSGAASAYVKEGYSNIRIGMFLEIATTIGAVIGASIVGIISVNAVSIIFAFILVYSALTTFIKKDENIMHEPDPIAGKLKLNGNYPVGNTFVSYNVQKVPQGFIMMIFAGVLSGLLGIGSGAAKVMAMDQIMKIPFKVSTTTSNFMIGVTAAASAGIYLKYGYIHAALVMPVMLGVLTGAFLGAKLLTFTSSKSLKIIFSVIILVMAYEMLKNGLK